MDFLKRLFKTMLGMLKKGIDLLRGKNLEDAAKTIGFALIGFFVLVCTGKSLRALRMANRKAGKTRGNKKRCGRKAKKHGIVKKLARKVLLG